MEGDNKAVALQSIGMKMKVYKISLAYPSAM